MHGRRIGVLEASEVDWRENSGISMVLNVDEQREAAMAANAAEIDYLEKVTKEQLNLGIALARE
jgi:hypothetical protein